MCDFLVPQEQTTCVTSSFAIPSCGGLVELSKKVMDKAHGTDNTCIEIGHDFISTKWNF